MHRILTLLLAFVLCVAANAQGLNVKGHLADLAGNIIPASAAAQTSAQHRAGENKIQQFPYLLGAFYEKLSDSLADYYVLCSSVAGQYNASTGAVTAPNGMLVSLDLYAAPNGGSALPEGTYQPGDGSKPFTFNTEYSYILVLDANSQATKVIALMAPISVTTTAGGQKLITTTFMQDGVERTMRFLGNVNFANTQQTTDIYYQLTTDLETTFTGGISLYYGDLYEANTGNMVLRLYDGDFDPETGAQTGSGTAVEIMLFNILFSDPKKAVIMPGHYTMARNFSSGTWFPGMEINYMGFNIAFGTFAQVLNTDNPSFGDEGYAWAYATSGTIDIEEIDGGNIRIVLDLTSKTGHAIRGTYEGPQFPVYDYSKEKNHAIISTLQEDLTLSLDYVKHAEIYNNGTQAGDTRSFIVDLGSDWDVDKGDDRFILYETDHNPYGADCMRLEFLVDSKAPYLPEGIYFVMEENYTTYFQAGRMRQGYFANGGEITGTRWMHLAPTRYYVMDGHAPARSGSVSVQRIGKNEANEDVYSFNINIVDDAGFNIVGYCAAPLRLHYDPTHIDPLAVGIQSPTIDTPAASTSISVYDLLGRRISAGTKGISLQGGRKVIR